MKRVVAIVVIMAVATTLFAFSVYADNVEPSYVTSRFDTDTINNVTITTNVYQLAQTYDTGTQNTYYRYLYVTLKINNTNSQAAKLNGVGFDILYPESNTYLWNYIDIDNMSEDLMLSCTGNLFTVSPSDPFSFNGDIVVPPNGTLYMIAKIRCTYNGSASTTSAQFSAVSNQTFNVSVDDYPYGVAVDYDPLYLFLDDQFQSLNVDLESIDTSINSLIDIVSYTGNFASPANVNITTKSASYDYITDYNLDLYMSARLYYMKPYYISYDVEYDSTSDSYHEVGYVRYTGMLFLNVYNRSSSNQYNGTYRFSVNNCLANNTNIIFDEIGSNLFNVVQKNGYGMYLYFKNKIYNHSVIPKRTYDVTYVVFHFDLPIGVSPDFGNGTFDVNEFWGTSISVDNDTYEPLNEYEILKDIYSSITNRSADDNTEEAQEMNDQIHDAEQVWYDNNSDALEQVGLSNYRFNTSQSNGITKAVTQFQAVWNALGDWTNVYIFILILSISTYIIRHEPTTRVKQYRSSVQAERAERISYYGRKNAESRASSSGSTLKNAIRRRK